MKIQEAFPVYRVEGDVGLELEVEYKKDPPIIGSQHWTTKHEGSLRGPSAEYVTTSAIPVDDKKYETIKWLTDRLPDAIQDSPRTSLHVHVNVQDHTVSQVYSLACVYWLLENLLIKFCGEELREGNHFCLRAADAESIIKLAAEDAKFKKLFRSFDRHGELRYSALNLASVRKFGSVEFRAMRGTTDPRIIDLWSNELHNLNVISKKFTPEELLDFYFNSSKASFLVHFFSPIFCKELVKIKKWQDLISENEGLVCELAYVTDWKALTYEKLPEGKKVKVKINPVDAFIEAQMQQGRVRPEDAPQVGFDAGNWARWAHDLRVDIADPVQMLVEDEG